MIGLNEMKNKWVGKLVATSRKTCLYKILYMVLEDYEYELLVMSVKNVSHTFITNKDNVKIVTSADELKPSF